MADGAGAADDCALATEEMAAKIAKDANQTICTEHYDMDKDRMRCSTVSKT